MNTNTGKESKRVQDILDQLNRFALGDYDGFLQVSERLDELDVVMAGINNLGDQLRERLGRPHQSAQSLESRNRELETEIGDMNRQLEIATHELNSFSYSVSHDLRSPLRAVHGYSQILAEDYGKVLDAEGNRLLHNIQSNVKRMGMLIDDLIKFSQMGRQHLSRSKISLDAVVNNVLQQFGKTLDNKVVIRRMPLGEAYADRKLIEMAYVNLIDNAIKYSRKREAPTIEVGSLNENGQVTYFVRDNGAGFDMKYYDKLFGVFQRLHRQDEFEGTGVGLAIVNRIISRHGGRVWAEGEVQQGATFYFTLGMRKNEPPANE